MKIMLIDDDYLTLDMLQNALIVNDYECDVYDSSVKAMESYSPYEYDVVLCDYVMPDVNGLEVLRHIKEINPEAVFVLYSAYPDKSVIKEAFEEGATDFLNKPIEWSAFIELLEFYDMATI